MLKRTLSFFMILCVIATMLCGCGKKPASTTGENIVPTSGNNGQQYDVLLDERTEETQYQYDLSDLSLVDTTSGQKITIGMTLDEIEEIIGAPVNVDHLYRVYAGVVVRYDEANKAVALIVSGGQFAEDAEKLRFKTSRGVGLTTAFSDFTKAYGDQYSQREEAPSAENEEVLQETPATAVRYFTMNGEKVEFLGTTFPQDLSREDESLYMQDFMFDRETNQIATMRITKASVVGK